jgi:hypothetical protein
VSILLVVIIKENLEQSNIYQRVLFGSIVLLIERIVVFLLSMVVIVVWQALTGPLIVA